MSVFVNAFDLGDSLVLPGTYTIDTLPDPAASVGYYAIVTDLFGEKTDKVLASSSAGTAYWQPVRPIYSKTTPVAADMTLLPLKHPSVQFLTGSVGIGVTRNVTLSPALAWPGATFEIRNDMTGLGALKLAGLSVGGLLSLVFGTQQRFFYEQGIGWKQFS